MALISLISFLALYLGYRFYSGFLEKSYKVNPAEIMPSAEFNDKVDYVPTNKFVLLGHHFSSISGAGPIVGPIIAGIAFGWLPALLWIVLGTIFIGGLHDYSSLIISIRHKGKSIAEIANLYINKRTYKIFLVFIWLALMYVVAVFADITAFTFSREPAVSQISVLYILIAFASGISIYRYKVKLSFATIIALLVIFIGGVLSLKFSFLVLGKSSWIFILLIYCVLASVLPVWLLLQPRDYLSSYLLYVSVALGVIGLFFGNFNISYPFFRTFSSPQIGALFPFLFITIACGAVSGFHSLVASGTTSKQISNIKEGRFIGYGGMALEAVVALIALGAVMLIAEGSSAGKMPPAMIFASGLAKFSAVVGVSPETGKTFGLLVISAFMLTTLDTATRIARYIFQEIIGSWQKGHLLRISATLISIVLPLILLTVSIKDASGNMIPCWKLVWPLFGITNQLLAALVLVIIYIWAKREKVGILRTILLPAGFMLIMTVWALFSKITQFASTQNYNFVFFTAVILLILSIWVIGESIVSVFRPSSKDSA